VWGAKVNEYGRAQGFIISEQPKGSPGAQYRTKPDGRKEMKIWRTSTSEIKNKTSGKRKRQKPATGVGKFLKKSAVKGGGGQSREKRGTSWFGGGMRKHKCLTQGTPETGHIRGGLQKETLLEQSMKFSGDAKDRSFSRGHGRTPRRVPKGRGARRGGTRRVWCRVRVTKDQGRCD